MGLSFKNILKAQGGFTHSHGSTASRQGSTSLCALRCREARRENRGARCLRRENPRHLATSLHSAKRAASWYWQRSWIEQGFRDAKSRFGLKRVRVSSPEHLQRLLMALSIALSRLTLMALPAVVGLYPETSALRSSPEGERGVNLLEKLWSLPLCCLLQAHHRA
jgi:hypothetical protein